MPYGAQHGDLGNLDADPDLELVYANGQIVTFKAGVATVDLLYTPGFGVPVRLGDIDNDGQQEIISAAHEKIRAFEAAGPTLKWEVSLSNPAGLIRVADINGDTQPDILVNDGKWGNIHALAGSGAEF